jgi:hypothetical protein
MAIVLPEIIAHSAWSAGQHVELQVLEFLALGLSGDYLLVERRSARSAPVRGLSQ